jgi:anthranilate synthase/aminodeoxychorismate synthase-like glutamine amidotransferase
VILLIDNYDSFVYNLARYFQRLGQETIVLRNDRFGARDVREMKPDAIVLSPGPCTPNEAGCSLDVVREFHQTIPMLGVCLGHQTIAAALGGRIVGAIEPMHGRTSEVFHYGRGIFAHIPNPLAGCRYHSLVVEDSSLPTCLEITAWTADGTVMAIRHRDRPVIGLQFHPESILTDSGYWLLVEFLRLAEFDVPDPFPTMGDELKQRENRTTVAPRGVLTF